MTAFYSGCIAMTEFYSGRIAMTGVPRAAGNGEKPEISMNFTKISIEFWKVECYNVK